MSHSWGIKKAHPHLTCACAIQTPYSTILGIRSRSLTMNDTSSKYCHDVVSGNRHAILLVCMPHSDAKKCYPEGYPTFLS